ncbi:zinc finger HIT domain-containing protein [Candidatus Bathyarchaeota archaeon]|nr:zinc finger HIT domain-containing protein [Candidatus Bathyarchaeota archaeon]
MQSNKTFANHLDDFEALQTHAENNPAATQITPREPPAKLPNAARRKQSASRASSATARSTPRPQALVESPAADGPPVLAPLEREDVKMEDGPAETPRPAVRLPEGAGDVEMLLQPRVPEMPSDADLRALLAGPPLSYSQARGNWDEEDRRYPPRMFCSVCGYWGRVKCVKCGTRVCALECLDLHKEGCVTRYGM